MHCNSDCVEVMTLDPTSDTRNVCDERMFPSYCYSGGIERDWEGVPRQFFDLKFKRTRCVCVRSTGSPSLPTIPDNGNGDLNHPNLSPYENCDPLSNTCMVQS